MFAKILTLSLVWFLASNVGYAAEENPFNQPENGLSSILMIHPEFWYVNVELQYQALEKTKECTYLSWGLTSFWKTKPKVKTLSPDMEHASHSPGLNIDDEQEAWYTSALPVLEGDCKYTLRHVDLNIHDKYDNLIASFPMHLDTEYNGSDLQTISCDKTQRSLPCGLTDNLRLSSAGEAKIIVVEK